MEWRRRHTSRAEQSCLHWSKWNTTYTILSSGAVSLELVTQLSDPFDTASTETWSPNRLCVLHVCTHRHTVNLNIRLNGARLWLKQGELYTFIQRWRFQGFQGRVRGRGYTLLFLQSVTRNTLALIRLGPRETETKVQEDLYMETETAFGGEEPGNTRRYARDSRGYTYKGKYKDPVRNSDPLRSCLLSGSVGRDEQQVSRAWVWGSVGNWGPDAALVELVKNSTPEQAMEDHES